MEQSPLPSNEQFITVKDAAKRLGIHVWKLDRAIRRGLVPHYRFLNTKRLVRLSEVISIIEASKAGGAS